MLSGAREGAVGGGIAAAAGAAKGLAAVKVGQLAHGPRLARRLPGRCHRAAAGARIQRRVGGRQLRHVRGRGCGHGGGVGGPRAS
jgi:hypothetical protein